VPAPEAEAKPKRTRRKKAEGAPEAAAPQPVAIEKAPEPAAAPTEEEAVAEAANDQPARKGWWQRTITGRF
jgi:ribonuclease E